MALSTSTYGILNFAAPNLATKDTTPQVALGTANIGNKNDTWVYVKASAALAIGTCAVDSTTFLASAGSGYSVDTAFAANDYGWVHKTTSPL